MSSERIVHQEYFEAVRRLMPVAEFSDTGLLLDANDHFLALTGYDLWEIQDKHHRTLCDPCYAESSEYRLFWSSLAAGQSRTNETQRVHKTGRPIWVRASYSPVVDDYGEVLIIINLVLDLTSTRRNLSALHYKMRPIKVSEQDNT
ncbi:MAG: PAS domain-containing protein [Planctomycetota bacterium]